MKLWSYDYVMLLVVMRDSTKNGVELKTKKEDREEITVEEEELFWQKGLLGDASAECLLLLLWKVVWVKS